MADISTLEEAKMQMNLVDYVGTTLRVYVIYKGHIYMKTTIIF